MPIITPSKSEALPPEQLSANSKIETSTYRTSLVDPREYPRGTILTNIQGNPLRVDYYSQVLGSDESAAQYDPGQTAVYQQYLHISNFELRMQGGLSATNDSTTSEMSLEGTAILYPGIIPNRGDVILTDVGDGRAGIFGVTNVEKKTLFKQAAYEITFKMLRYLTALEKKDLLQKTVEEYVFRKDYITYGRYPFITRQDELESKNLSVLLGELRTMFLNHFYSQKNRCILLPSQQMLTYDPYLAKAFLRVVNVEDDTRIPKIKLLNVDDHGLNSVRSPWDMLLDRNNDLRSFVFKKAGLITSGNFSNNALLKSIRFTDVDYVVVPDDVPLNVDFEHLAPPKPTIGLFADAYSQDNLVNVGNDSDYLFTDAFYANDKPAMSVFERMVDRYLNHEHNAYNELVEAVRQVKQTTLVNRAYGIVVLMILLIAEMRNE